MSNKGRHGFNKEEFEKLTFRQQANSISATLMNLEAAVKAHRRKAVETLDPKGRKRNPSKTLEKCIAQISRMVDRLKKLR